MNCKLKAAPPQLDVLDAPQRRALPHATPYRVTAPSRGRALLEEYFGLVQKRLSQLSYRSGLPEHEAEEFHSWALFKLVENDYRIPGSWEGRSSFSTYLTVALVNLLRDYRIHLWGKWRPSAAARRLGREAVLLERLRFRDHLAWTEAFDRVREAGSSLSNEELERLADYLPERNERRTVGEEELLRLAVDGHVEERVEEAERARVAKGLCAKLFVHLHTLSSEDRLLLKLHFRDGLKIAAISPLLGIPQKLLYVRRDRCLKRLRQALEADLDHQRVQQLFDSSWALFTDREAEWE